MKLNITRISALLLISATLMSCRGQLSEKPPILPQQNMYLQERFNAQQENPFFEDGRAMRMPLKEPLHGVSCATITRHFMTVWMKRVNTSMKFLLN
jgi:hypothetical protein